MDEVSTYARLEEKRLPQEKAVLASKSKKGNRQELDARKQQSEISFYKEEPSQSDDESL
jgi:hypothetical protein